MPFTRSTFENGSYQDRNWFCACDRPAIWRVVSKEGPTRGERFLRCNPPGVEPQCSFFLWEVHEASARNKLAQRASPRPITPPSTSTNTPNSALYLPTPSTVSSSVSMLTTHVRRLMTPEESPTRRRGKDADASPVTLDGEDDEDDESTLLSQIVARLGTDGFRPKLSTKEYLGHILREEIAIYEAKLRTRDVTIARLSSRLDELTANKIVKVEA